MATTVKAAPSTGRPTTQQLGTQQLGTQQVSTQQVSTMQLGSQQPTTQQPTTQQPTTQQQGTEQPSSQQLSTQQLAGTARRLAARPEEWISRVRLSAGGRWYEQIHAGDGYDVWLISWLPGQSTGFHDHGGSAGAFALAWGVLEEHRQRTSVVIGAGHAREIEPDIVHDVRNTSAAPAVSVHAYSPPLTGMTRYEVTGDELVAARTESTRDWMTAQPPGARMIDEILASARARLGRLTPRQAFRELTHGATLVDIRPAAQRAAEGGIPGAIVVERNVLEWRFDPASEARLASVTGYGDRVIVICSEGYTSSLAAAALHDLGLIYSTDVAGGFRAWAAAGLPVAAPATTPPGGQGTAPGR